MKTIASVPVGCGCCMNRRQWLAAGCGACLSALATQNWGRVASADEGGSGASGALAERPRVRLVFACFALKQQRPTWPHIGYDFGPDIERMTRDLQQACLDVELVPAVAHSPEDAQKLLASDESDRIDGYVIYQMNNWVQVMQTVVASGRPTLVADFPYAGSGGFLVYTAGLRRAHGNVSMIGSTRLDDLAAMIRCFALLKQGKTTAEFVAACDRVRRERTPQYGNSACASDSVQVAGVGDCLEALRQSRLVTVGGAMQKLGREIKELIGIEVIEVDFPEFVSVADQVDLAQGQELAARWQSSAKSVSLDDPATTLLASARLYLAQQAMLKKYNAEAITINCLGGFYGGHLKAYPCLGFVELLDAGLVGACEADLLSTATMLAMKHLVGRPGFISDPVLDLSQRQIIYAHCVAPTRMFGPGTEANAFEILTHSEDRQGASVRSFLPVGYMTTTMEIHPGRKEILVHRAKAVDNVVIDRACRTKLAGEVVGDYEKLHTYWDQYGWHRVTFYGDLLEPVRELADGLKFRFVEEA